MTIFSLHGISFLFGTTLSVLFSACGMISYALTSLLVGGAFTLFVFKVFPIRHFSPPVDGDYDVGIEEAHIRDENGDSLPLTIFYPIERSSPGSCEGSAARSAVFSKRQGKKIPWVPFGDNRFLKGLARHASLPYILFSHLLLLKVEVPEESSCPPLVEKDGTLRPVILFTHGIAGFSRLYTALLQQVASRGSIIFAVTHTDQSAAFCRDSSNKWSVPMDCTLAFTKESRKGQLGQRCQQVVFVAEQIRSGKLFTLLGYSKDEIFNFFSRSPPIHFMGHSFGGSTVLSTVATGLMSASPRKISNLGVGKIVCLDPWFDPIEDIFSDFLIDHKIEKLSSFSHCTLILLSEEWKRLTDDAIIKAFENCQNVFQVNIKIYPGTDHAYFCDVRVLSRIGKKDYCVVDPEKQVHEWGKIIASFIYS